MDSSNNLPILNHIDKILTLIEDNLVVQINAPTGSGKSVGIPKILAEQNKRVFVSVPTRVSATSLHNYLNYLNPKISIGYAAEGNVMYYNDTQVVYATSGHTRRKLLNYFSKGILHSKYGLNFTDVLVLDETHSGSVDNSIIISLWMHAVKQNIHVPKLVLLSATPSDILIEPQPVVYAIPVPAPFPVKIIYEPPDIYCDVYDHAYNIVLSKHRENILKGNFLVFVPGARDADDLVDRLREKITDALIIPAYSTLEANDLKLIYTQTSDGRRKIIIATNIAESSITIEGLELVIDTMYCKEVVASSSGATRLETINIVKSSAQQRSGRVGRTAPGICYRLISESNYELLKQHREPEIGRIPIHNIVMEFFKAGIDPTNTIIGIQPDHVRKSIKLLTRLKLLDKFKDNIVVTECGDFVPNVPLGVRNATFLWRWIKQGYPIYPGVVIASIIDVHSTGYFYIPHKKRDMSPIEYNKFCDDYINKHFKDWIGQTPIHTYLNMWCSFVKFLGRSHYNFIINPYSVNYRRWTRNNSINDRQFWDVISIISQTYRTVRINRQNVNVSVFDTTEMIDNAVPILQDIYNDNIMTPYGMNQMSHPKTKITHIFDSRRIISISERNPERLVAIATHEIITRMGRPLGYVDLFVLFPLITPKSSDSDSDAYDYGV